MGEDSTITVPSQYHALRESTRKHSATQLDASFAEMLFINRNLTLLKALGPS